MSSIESRFSEVDSLLVAAAKIEFTDVKLHDAICRCVVVLLAAHLEGFVRDATKAVVDDINRYSSFRSLQDRPKRTFCKLFIPEEGAEANERVTKLIDLLDGLDTKLTWECFLATTEHEGHKNATPATIDRVFRNFGTRNIFGYLSDSQLDDVFSCTAPELENLETVLKDHVTARTIEFPYTTKPAEFKLDSASTKMASSRTLWETFVDDLMLRRHRIAHGAVVDNRDSVRELCQSRRKIAVLQYGLLIVLCSSIVPLGGVTAD